MILFTQRLAPPAATDVLIPLTFEQRQRSLLRTQLDDGKDVGIRLARGELPDADTLLQATTGEIAQVLAAPESLSVCHSTDALLFSRACYHLGNRHVKLQIEPGKLCYLHDHVLDDMLRQLGLEVAHELAAFSPETGAYAGGHAHHHDDDSHHHHEF